MLETPKATVDRVKVSQPLISPESFKGAMALLHSFAGEDGVKVWKDKYVTMASVPLGKGKKLKIGLGCSHEKGFVTFDFPAGALDSQQKTRLDEVLVTFQWQGGLEQVAQVGKVTYIELAFDFLHVEWVGLVPFDFRLKDSCWQPSYVAKNPTAYMGSRASNRVVCCYDRKRKLAQAEKVYTDNDCARVEVRLRRVGCSPLGLVGLKNPLLNTGIASWTKLCAAEGDSDWENFLWQCKKEGAPVALRVRPLAVRKVYLARMRKCEVEWWLPDQLWKLAPAAVQAAFSPAMCS